MDVPSMVQRSGDTLIVRSVVSGNQIYFDQSKEKSSIKPQLIQQETALSSSLGCLEHSAPLEDGIIRQNNCSQAEDFENQTVVKDEGLPQCKIKRNYSCNSCTFFTQNPRYFLTHLRDKHGEKIVINECKLCLYASRHYQKLVRHMKMVHGSTDGIEENGIARKRQLSRETRKRKIENQSSIALTNSQSSSLQIVHLENQAKATPDVQQSSYYKQPKMEDFLEDTSKNRLKCSLCEFTTLHRSQLIVHESDEHCNAKFFRCEKCSYVTHIKARFSKHVKYHSMPMIKCFTCDFRTPYKWNLDRHMKNHGGTGAFKCAACNFTADIKQSLTVHEMNHHVPPVGNAAGMTNLRRKNKVGGTDISDEMLSEVGDIEEDSNSINNNCSLNENFNNDINIRNSNTNFGNIKNNNYNDHSNNAIEYSNNNDKNCSNKNNNNTKNDNSINNDNNNNISSNNKNNKNFINNNGDVTKISKDCDGKNDNNSNFKSISVDISTQKNKCKGNKQYMQLDNINSNANNNNINEDVNANRNCTMDKTSITETETKYDGNVLEYESFPSNIKKFKYNEDLPTDLSHKSVLHNVIKPNFGSSNKSSRPIPNLIPIQTGSSNVLSNKSLNLYNDIQLQDEMHNLRQIATMLFGKDIPQELLLHLPQLSPCSDNSSKSGVGDLSNSGSYTFHKKSENVFDKLKQRFAEDENNTVKLENLTCTCGHVSKCLSEQYIHHNTCRNTTYTIDKNQNLDCKKHSSVSPINLSVNSNSVSTRCQFCRHRCKSSADLTNHLKNCEIGNQNDFSESSNGTVEHNINEEDAENPFMTNKHPMENKVFIWNDINNSNKNLKDSDLSNIVLTAINKVKKGNINKIDVQQTDTLNHCEGDGKSDEISYYGVETAPGYGEVTKTITSEEDTVNASLKKVYKCPHCSFWASTASRFHVHIVGHLNKKPFECSLCNYRSNWRWDITKHIRLKTIRDPSHKNARVLMNDETGRRNYTKYNKYITLMKVTDEDGDPKLMKSGEMTPNQEASLSFIKDYENKHANGIFGGANALSETGNTSLTSNLNSYSNEDKKENIQLPIIENKLVTDQYANLTQSEYTKDGHANKRALPDLIKSGNLATYKPCDEDFVYIKSVEDSCEKNKLYRCKECNYKHANRDMLVAHVKQHTSTSFDNLQNNMSSPLDVKVNSNYANLMNDMLTLILKQQQSGKEKLEEDLVQQAQTFAALNLNLVSAASVNNKQQGNINNHGNSCNAIQNEHGETDEASSVGVVTTTTTTPTNNVSFSPNATASTNYLLNKNTQDISNNKNNSDVCKKCITVANIISSSNVMVNGNSTSGSSNTSVIGGIISGCRSSKNNLLNTHSTIEQNINHYNFNNILNHSNNMGNNGGHSHNNTDQWRGPAPYRCGHCHQVSNWKHVIQRHCRLKHNGDIRIETIDRLSDRFAPVYRPLGANSTHQSGRRSSQNIQINNQLPSQLQNNENSININSEVDNISSPLYTELNTSKNEKVLKSEPVELPTQVLNSSGNSSKSKQQFCPQCPYVSESKSQMNYHISLHKAKQYECKICGLLFNKKQQLFIHTKHTHDDQQQSVMENILNSNIRNIGSLSNNVLSSKPNSNMESSDDENEEEGRLVIDLISSCEKNNTDSKESRNVLFCQECPTRYLSKHELCEHLKYHQTELKRNEQLNHKCDFCSFKAKQEYSLLTHFSVHRQGYQDRTEALLRKFKEDKEFPRPTLEKIIDIWVVKTKSISKSDNPLRSVNIHSSSLFKKQLQEDLILLEQCGKSSNKDDNNLTRNEDHPISNDKPVPTQSEKCSYCPFETTNLNIYKDHLKYHYTLSKIKLKCSCPHCDFSCSEEQTLKSHIQVHFEFLNKNKTVAFFTSYNNLELNLKKNLNNTYENNENISDDLVLYRSPNINMKNINTQSGFDNDKNFHNKNEKYKNVIDIKTGQTLAVERK